MRKLYLIAFLFVVQMVKAQELFVFTEPASNMPSKSVGVRLMQSFMRERATTATNYHAMPEVMFGFNKQLMAHVQGFISNRADGSLVAEGISVYGKYLFLSKDQVHSHFRMAAFARLAVNNADIHQQEIETMGHNSGYELGLVATQLINKVAINVSSSFEQAYDDGKVYPNKSSSAINYTVSVGKLMLPKVYTSYKQVNLNAMLEMLGQYNNQLGYSFLDIAPAIQFIFNSQARVDVGYRKQVYSNMQRTAPDGFILKLEWIFFNAWK
jgi:hypothetical protein